MALLNWSLTSSLLVGITGRIGNLRIGKCSLSFQALTARSAMTASHR